MIKVYTASDLQEAQMISDLLERNGIDYLVKNKDLQSIMGEIPIDTYPTIWVNEHEAKRSKKLIDDINRRKVEGSIWTCSCGESIEPQFQVCWNCQEAKPR